MLQAELHTQQRLVDRGAAAEAVHRDLDVAEPLLLGTALDELLVHDHVHRQVQQPELLREADLAGFGGRAGLPV